MVWANALEEHIHCDHWDIQWMEKDTTVQHYDLISYQSNGKAYHMDLSRIRALWTYIKLVQEL